MSRVEKQVSLLEKTLGVLLKYLGLEDGMQRLTKSVGRRQRTRKKGTEMSK